MALKVVIVISIAVVIGGFTVWSVLNSVVEPLIAPRAELSDLQFTDSSCEPDYLLFWVVGHHRMVTATFRLKNDGFTDGHVRVLFTAEGAQVAQHDFFIGAGKTEAKSFQFRVDDCLEHSFSAQLGGVTRS